MKYAMALVAISLSSLVITGCGGGGGQSGTDSAPGNTPQAGTATAPGNIPQALVGKWMADVPQSLGQQCPNGEIVKTEDIRILSIRADGGADFSAVGLDNGVTDGCSGTTGGTCNLRDELDFPSAAVAVGGQNGTTLELTQNSGTETVTSSCNSALNTSQQVNRPTPVSMPWALVTSPKTGRAALEVPGKAFGITCPDSFNATGNDCATILFEQVQ